MKIVKNILCILLAFLLMMSILIFTVCSIAPNYLNKEYVISKLEETDVYKQIYDEIHSGFDEYIKQSGLEISSLKTACNEEKIKKDFLAVVDYIYDGEEIIIETEEIKSSLDAEINEKLESQNRKVTKEELKNIAEFEEKIVNYYTGTFSSYEKINDIVGDKIEVLKQAETVKRWTIIVGVVCALLIILASITDFFHATGFIGIAILSSGGLLAIMPSVIYVKLDVDKFDLGVDFANKFISLTVKEFLNFISIWGLRYICVGIGIVLVSSIFCGIFKKNK